MYYLWGMAVHFHSHELPITLRRRRALKAFLQELFRREGESLKRLDYVFCTDAYLLAINQQFLGHGTYTDILTFDLSEPGERGITGEVYISAERVQENARKFGASFEEELHRVIFHGALHLCGYGDKTPEEQTRMRAKENDCLKRYFQHEDHSF